MSGGIDLADVARRAAREGFGEWVDEILLTEDEWDQVVALVAQLAQGDGS